MNPIIKFMLGFANIPEQAINDLEKQWPSIRKIADAAKELEPYLEQATPHINALEPLGIKMFPIVQRIWPDILELLPVADEWIDIVSKKSQ